jgi:hypothetical protein
MDEALRGLTEAHYTCVKIKTCLLPYSYAVRLRTLLMIYLVRSHAFINRVMTTPCFRLRCHWR